MPKYPTREQVDAMPLRQQARAHADAVYRDRLAQLKRLDRQLALLEAEHATIKAAGFNIHASQVRREFLGSGLEIESSLYVDSQSREYAALLAAGFTAERKSPEDTGSRAYILKKGRLSIRMYFNPEAIALAAKQQKPATAEVLA